MEKTITREIKITKTIYPGTNKVEYNLQAQVDPDELVGILTRIMASVQAGEMQSAKTDNKNNTYIG